MPIEFSCSSCSTVLRVPEEHAGKQAKCPQCENLNLIPSGSQPASEAPPMPGGPGTNQAKDANPFATGQPQGAAYGAAAGYGMPYRTAHRGGMILTLGILGIMCNFFMIPGVCAWVMGRGDLKQMEAGVMDPDGRGLTQAGMILGIIGTVLVLATILIYLAIFLIMILGATAGAAGGM